MKNGSGRSPGNKAPVVTGGKQTGVKMANPMAYANKVGTSRPKTPKIC